SLGSTIGIAVLGALLTQGLATSLSGIHNDPYVRALSSNAEVKAMGDLEKTDTLLNLNMPSTKEKISESFTATTASLPDEQRKQLTEQFDEQQSAYSSKI